MRPTSIFEKEPLIPSNHPVPTPLPVNIYLFSPIIVIIVLTLLILGFLVGLSCQNQQSPQEPSTPVNGQKRRPLDHISANKRKSEINNYFQRIRIDEDYSGRRVLKFGSYQKPKNENWIVDAVDWRIKSEKICTKSIYSGLREGRVQGRVLDYRVGSV